MSKKENGEGVNKSEMIRKFMEENPSAGPKAVVEAMKTLHNIDVKAQFVSTIKSNDRRKGKPAGKRGRKPGSTNTPKASKAPAAGSTSGGITLETLLAAKDFIQKIGGLKKAKAAVDLLAGLSD